MIYITGDTHGEYERFSNRYMRKQGLELGEKDYVIVCGDFGLCWARDPTFIYNCKFFADKKYTTLWIQGNHENYDMIEEYPVEEWHGGKVRHIVEDKVILLERGQVFEIEGKTFFTFGGAASHDIQGGILDREDKDYDNKRRKAIRRGLPFRINHETWWEQELPNEDEMNEGRNHLAGCGYKVDYVLTHCCATSVQKLIDRETGRQSKPDILTDYLQEIEEKLAYKHWYFGHYHMDLDVDEKHSLLYHAMVPIREKNYTQITGGKNYE
ncbi:MAG: metallophosphoesterase [Lachnospiraceae bacterium]